MSEREYFLKDFQTLKDEQDIIGLLQGRNFPLTFVVNFLRVIKPEKLLKVTEKQLGVDLSPSTSSLNPDVAAEEGRRPSVSSVSSVREVDSVGSLEGYSTDEDDSSVFGFERKRMRRGSYWIYWNCGF